MLVYITEYLPQYKNYKVCNDSNIILILVYVYLLHSNFERAFVCEFNYSTDMIIYHIEVKMLNIEGSSNINSDRLINLE